ncbi:flavodoxin family protein [Chloroflexota bacterium]
MVDTKKKVIALSCGRKNGNGELLLKEALMAAEELGVAHEIIHAMDLRVKPCRGCETCTMAMARGEEARCSIRDDDMEWILERTLVDDAALIVACPVYHQRANGYFEIINERMLPTMFRHPEILKKTRVGAIISSGGGAADGTSLALSTMNIFVQHTRKLVDQMQTNYCGSVGTVLMHDEYVERARRLGQNVARAMQMPIEEVRYAGEQKAVACPVCHCDVVQVPAGFPDVYCPVCWVRGVVEFDSGKLTVQWNEEDASHPRYSEYGIGKHLEMIAGLQEKYFKEDRPVITERAGRYMGYGNYIRP